MSTSSTAQAAVTYPRQWHVQIPAPCAWISANDRLQHHARAALTKAWRDRAWAAFRRAKLPTGLGRVRVDVQLHFDVRRYRDAENYADTVKPVVDALGPAWVRPPTRKAPKGSAAPGIGLIVDDTPAHLDGPHITIGRPWPEVAPRGLARLSSIAKPGGMTVIITDLTNEGDAR